MDGLADPITAGLAPRATPNIPNKRATKGAATEADGRTTGGRTTRGVPWWDPSLRGSLGRGRAAPMGLATVVAWGLATCARLSLPGLAGVLCTSTLRATCIGTVCSSSTGTVRWTALSCRGATGGFGAGSSDLAPVSVQGLATDTYVVRLGRAVAPSTSSGWSTRMGERRCPSACSRVPPCSSSTRCRCSGVSGTSNCNKTLQWRRQANESGLGEKRYWDTGVSPCRVRKLSKRPRPGQTTPAFKTAKSSSMEISWNILDKLASHRRNAEADFTNDSTLWK